jgi:hypothetical protein
MVLTFGICGETPAVEVVLVPRGVKEPPLCACVVFCACTPGLLDATDVPDDDDDEYGMPVLPE